MPSNQQRLRLFMCETWPVNLTPMSTYTGHDCSILPAMACFPFWASIQGNMWM